VAPPDVWDQTQHERHPSQRTDGARLRGATFVHRRTCPGWARGGLALPLTPGDVSPSARAWRPCASESGWRVDFGRRGAASQLPAAFCSLAPAYSSRVRPVCSFPRMVRSARQLRQGWTLGSRCLRPPQIAQQRVYRCPRARPQWNWQRGPGRRRRLWLVVTCAPL